MACNDSPVANGGNGRIILRGSGKIKKSPDRSWLGAGPEGEAPAATVDTAGAGKERAQMTPRECVLCPSRATVGCERPNWRCDA